VKSALVLAAIASPALADDPPPQRPVHGSVGAGGSFLVTGADGDRNRLDAALDLKPRSRFGVSLQWRAIDPREAHRHRGLVIAGLVYEGAAARPRLVLDLHADAGFDLDVERPLLGGGARTTLTIIAPLAVILDSGLYLVLDGIDDSRLQLQSSALVGVRW